jgi:outer membrane receptor protein involved in Fe transport
MHTNRLISSLRRGAALALACLLAPAGFGQAAPTPSTSTAASSAAQQLDTFEVTGSRIRGLVGEADFSPMVTIGRMEIELAGLTSMGEIARLIPQAFSQGSYEGMGMGGQAQGQSTVSDGSTASSLTQRTNINMRGLGAANTLVLVDGRRLARSGNIRGSDGYDLSGIPVSAIERIEVVTDGASAIYGSDAMGGVINIITRKNYSGTELALAYENTFDSDTAVRNVTLNHGLRRGPLSLTLTASYQKRNAFAARDRYFSATDDWRTLGGTSNFATYGAGGFAMGAGVVQAASGVLPGVGSQYARIPDNATGSGLTLAQFVATTANAELGDRAKYVNNISPQFSRAISARGTYSLRSGMQFYGSAGFNDTRTHIEGMPVNYRNYIGVNTVLIPAPIPANYPGNVFGVPIQLNKTFWELPYIQGEKFAVNANRSVAGGVTGRFASDWRYDLGMSWNRATLLNENALDPVLNTDAYNAAIASRTLVLFYDSRTQRPNDLGLLKSLLRRGDSSDRTDTITWSASADGPLPWLKLPAGPIRLASGVERTTEKIKTFQTVPDSPLINLSLLGGFNRSLTSAFTETRIPIVAVPQNIPGFHRLDLTAALRYDDYSDVGSDINPRYGAQYRPLKWLLFRATRNHSFRAPSVQSLYRPVTESTNTNPGGFIDRQRNELVTGTMITKLGGNMNLKPEKAMSDNIGVVFEVPFALFKGLSFSVDRMQLEYKDQISSLSTLQEWADLFPERLIRETTGPQPGRVIGVDNRSTNIARLMLESFDYQVNYQRSTAWGSFYARFAATEYRRLDSFRIPGAAPTSTLYLRPTRLSWQTSWSKGRLGAGVSGFYQENSWTSNARTFTQFASVIEWNTQVSYDFGYKSTADLLQLNPGKRTWTEWMFSDLKLAVAVNNVFDREPPHRQGNAGYGVIDPRMRRYSLTLRKKL